jgi:hypothetical protein
VLVTAYAETAARCQVTNWISGSSGTDVNVNCTDATGAAADVMFDPVYSINETAGYGHGSANSGAIFTFNDTKTTPYDVSGKYSLAIYGETMYAQRVGKGQYSWSMAVEPPWTSDIALVTAYNAPGNYRSSNGWFSDSISDAASMPANTRVNATLAVSRRSPTGKTKPTAAGSCSSRICAFVVRFLSEDCHPRATHQLAFP